MNEIVSLTLLVMLAGIIAGIGYACYKAGYDKGYQSGMDMQRLLVAMSDKGGGES